MQRPKRLHLIALAAASLLIIPASDAAAQVQMKLNIQGAARGSTGSRHSTTNANRMALFLEMYIEEMQSVCELSDGQVKKLALAGKSTSRKLFSTGGAQMQFGLTRIGGNPANVDEDSLSDEDAASQESNERPGKKFNIKQRVRLNAVTSHSLWKKAIKSVLTDEQRDKWTQSRSERTKRTREQLVNHRVTDLEQQLFLRPEQVAAVRGIVERIEGDQLVKDFNAGGKNTLRIPKGGKKPAKVSKNDLKDVLSPVQMKAWTAPSEGFTPMQGVIEKALGLQPGDAKSADSDVGIEFDDGGLKVKSVAAKSLAGSLGIQVGDVIDTVDGEPVDTTLQFQAAMKKGGKNASVTVLRNNAEVRLEKK